MRRLPLKELLQPMITRSLRRIRLGRMAESSLLRKILTTRKFTLLICWPLLLTPSGLIACRLIIDFKVEEIKEGEEFKVNWKDVEKAVREAQPTLKLIYARGDDHGGQLAFS